MLLGSGLAANILVGGYSHLAKHHLPSYCTSASSGVASLSCRGKLTEECILLSHIQEPREVWEME